MSVESIKSRLLRLAHRHVVDLERLLALAHKARLAATGKKATAATDRVLTTCESMLDEANRELGTTEAIFKVDVAPSCAVSPTQTPGLVGHHFITASSSSLVGWCSCGWPSPPQNYEFEGQTYVDREKVLRKAWNMHARQAKKREGTQDRG